MSSPPIKLLVVDDNDFVAESLRRRLAGDPGFEWCGWLDSTAALPTALKERSPTCGVCNTHVGGELVAGPGVTSELLRRNGIEVEGVEGRRD